MTSNGRPIIGITSYAQPARWGAWELPAALVPLYYVESVEQAGGRALVVPPSEEAVEETLDVLDGIVFSGGIDIDPARYGAERHPATDPAQAHRDAGELRLLEAALERDLPTLAICRGFQLLNVLARRRPRSSISRRRSGTRVIARRSASSRSTRSTCGRGPGSRRSSGRRHEAVRSSHHQGVGRVGAGLVESAYAEDGSLEAFEDPSKQFALGRALAPRDGGGRQAALRGARRRGAALPRPSLTRPETNLKSSLR